MTITDINKLKTGDTFTYKGEKALVTRKRPAFPPDFMKDDKGKMMEVPDKSVGLSFTYLDKTIHLESRIDSKMVVDGVFLLLDLPDYVKSNI